MFSLTCILTKNDAEFLPIETMWNFQPEKLDRKKARGKKRGYFDHRNYIEKVGGNYVEIRQNLVFHVST